MQDTHSERKRDRDILTVLCLLLLISAHILMEHIKSEWPNREFQSDNGIHHISVLEEKSPLRSSLAARYHQCDAGYFFVC